MKGSRDAAPTPIGEDYSSKPDIDDSGPRRPANRSSV